MTTPTIKCKECKYEGEICGCGGKCPLCKGNNILLNKGSTNLIPLKNINWLCKDCLYEW